MQSAITEGAGDSRRPVQKEPRFLPHLHEPLCQSKWNGSNAKKLESRLTQLVVLAGVSYFKIIQRLFRDHIFMNTLRKDTIGSWSSLSPDPLMCRTWPLTINGLNTTGRTHKESHLLLGDAWTQASSTWNPVRAVAASGLVTHPQSTPSLQGCGEGREPDAAAPRLGLLSGNWWPGRRCCVAPARCHTPWSWAPRYQPERWQCMHTHINTVYHLDNELSVLCSNRFKVHPCITALLPTPYVIQ